MNNQVKTVLYSIAGTLTVLLLMDYWILIPIVLHILLAIRCYGHLDDKPVVIFIFLTPILGPIIAYGMHPEVEKGLTQDVKNLINSLGVENISLQSPIKITFKK